ncbi:DUF6221 family protein [Ruania rhizosphaerae]|uniref:DUF6221 family protein n=1 Tax=Ruania rhizosphaerae TaxID=1840413 RepID=UPI001356E119|nr:DUF6221 family protein [Ruania rhizosphaerae]
MSIVEFLAARLDQDEAEVGPYDPNNDEGAGPNGIGWAEVGAIGEVLMASSSRVLAEVRAHRAIMEEHEPYLGDTTSGFGEVPGCWTCDVDQENGIVPSGWCPTLRALAAVYADHPDYDDSWLP